VIGKRRASGTPPRHPRAVVIILEGPADSGKSQLKEVIEQRSSYASTVMVGFGISQLVYAAYFKRPLWTSAALRDAHVAMVRRFLRAVHPLYVLTRTSSVVSDFRAAARPSADAVYKLYLQMFTLVGVPACRLLKINMLGTLQASQVSGIIESRVRTMAGT